MKTIFIPIFQGVAALNILRTDVLKKLRQNQCVRIILLLSSQAKLDYYKNIFPEADDLKYVLFPALKTGWLEKFFSYLKVYLLRAATMDLKRRYGYYQSRNFPRFAVSFITNRFLAKPTVRRLARFFDQRLRIDTAISRLFEDFKPTLVFLPHLFGDDETAILRAASRRGVASIGFINSWDKLTSRSILRLLPDYLAVPNEITKKEAVDFHDMTATRIFVSGAPQFDIYKKFKPTARETFLQSVGLSTETRFILFCPMGKTFSDSDWQFMELIEGFIANQSLPSDLRVLARFPPNDTVQLKDKAKLSHFVFTMPGVRFTKTRGVDWDMNESDLQSLFDSIYWSELVICPPSTVSIDAAILDKPIINLGFDFVPEKSYRSILRFYGATHYQNIMELGGISLAKNKDDLLGLIKSYLSDPRQNVAGRLKIVESQVERLDGKAGERIAGFILDILNKS